MGPKLGRWRALANAGLVATALGLAVYGVFAVSGRQWRVQPTFRVPAEFATVSGIAPGDRVRLQGIDAGVVESLQPPGEPGGPVRLVLRVDERLRHLVRADALARIVVEGVVGAKVVEIVPGRVDAPPLDPSKVLPGERPAELADLLKKAGASLARLDAVSDAAERGLGEITAIAATVRKGEGSLGKLYKEDDAYRRLVELTEKGERTLQDVEENLDAVKRTWPISRYFNDRSFFDRERVLFHPGAERDCRTLRETELFAPGRSTLTADGRRRLDGIAAWFKLVKRPASELVIAAFTDPTANPDSELARVLTQEQAEAVRQYLVTKHSINSAGWFSTRKVAVVGFGHEVPRTNADSAGTPALPSRRVDVIVFTPQA